MSWTSKLLLSVLTSMMGSSLIGADKLNPTGERVGFGPVAGQVMDAHALQFVVTRVGRRPVAKLDMPLDRDCMVCVSGVQR